MWLASHSLNSSALPNKGSLIFSLGIISMSRLLSGEITDLWASFGSSSPPNWFVNLLRFWSSSVITRALRILASGKFWSSLLTDQTLLCVNWHKCLVQLKACLHLLLFLCRNRQFSPSAQLSPLVKYWQYVLFFLFLPFFFKGTFTMSRELVGGLTASWASFVNLLRFLSSSVITWALRLPTSGTFCSSFLTDQTLLCVNWHKCLVQPKACLHLLLFLCRNMQPSPNLKQLPLL